MPDESGIIPPADHVEAADGDGAEEAERRTSRTPLSTDLEEVLAHVRELVSGARAMPLSSSAMVNREELLEVVDHALTLLPEELKRARWLLREGDEYLAKVRREGDEILDLARAQAGKMVQRTEVVQEAKRKARRIVQEADDEARRLVNEAEDYTDKKLASFEIALERTLKSVRAGREQLQPVLPEVEADPEDPTSPVFDQDLA